jgi:tetratricopeptide (TPR) repeat protein
MTLRRPGGISNAELKAALNAFAGASTPKALETAVREHPALSTPVIHALLRQDRLHGTFAGEKIPSDVFSAGWLPRYNDLFALLFAQHHDRLNRQVRAGEHNEKQSSPAKQSGPAMLLTICAALEDHPLPLVGPTRDPLGDSGALAADLRDVLGYHVDLPPYEPTAGTRWTLTVVKCSRCDRAYPVVRATHVELKAVSAMAELAGEGCVNDSWCPECGTRLCQPARVWVADARWPRHRFHALAAIWQLGPNDFGHQAPPGMWRVPDADRIIEIWFETLRDQEPFEPRSDGASSFGWHGIAYSSQELGDMAADAVERNAEDPALREIGMLCLEIARKLEGGLLALFEAETFVLQLVSPDWPVELSLPSSHSNRRLALAFALVREAIARTRPAPPAIRAETAATVAGAYTRLGETALAQAMLARADDALAEADDIPPSVRDRVLEQRILLLSKLGHQDAATALNRSLSSGGVDMPSWPERVTHRARAGERLLERWTHGDPDAVAEYPQQLAAVQALLDEVSDSDDLAADALRAGVLVLYSADLANFAAALMDVGEPNVETLGLARTLLVKALPMSVETEMWEYATTQSSRLVRLSVLLNDLSAAESYARSALRYAEQAGDHRGAQAAAAWLSQRTGATARVTEAAEFFERAALEAVRESIGIGYDETLIDLNDLAAVGVSLLAYGSDPARVATTLESIRAVRTANAIQRQMPRSGSDPNERQAAGLRSENYARWADATGTVVATPSDVRAHLRELGTGAVWLTVLSVKGALTSIAIWDDGASVGSPIPLSQTKVWDDDAKLRFAGAVLYPHPRLLDMAADDLLVVSLPHQFSGVPIGALPFGGSTLCTHVGTVCVHGIGTFEAAASAGARDIKTALLVGASFHPSGTPLPGAQSELVAIEGILHDAGVAVTRLDGNSATVEALFAAVSEADLVHIACHTGSIGTEGEAALLLTPDQTNTDGLLSEERILADLRLKPGAFVNLSACRTGHATVAAGPVFDGFVSKLLVANARSVVGSLWPVADSPTAVFQEAFYRHLLASRSPAHALSAAQTDALAGRLGREPADPTVWGAFVLYGAG